MTPEELEALASAVAEKTGEFRKPRQPMDPKKVVGWATAIATIVAMVWGGVLTGWEQVQSRLWGEELRTDLQYVREHIDSEGPEFVQAVEDLKGLVPAVESLTSAVQKNESADRTYRVGQFLRDCRQEQRQAGRDGIPWTRDCAHEYADSLRALTGN